MSANDWADERLGSLLASRYRVVKKLGVGGMGAVYSSTDVEGGIDVAVKILDPQLAEHPYFLQRFEREAKAAGRVAGGSVPRILDSGHDPSCGPFLVMELLQGRTLATHLKSVGPLSVEESLRINDDILEILVAVHEGGIVHRDLKPANVFLEGVGSPWDVRVIDFGVARFFELNRDTLLTLPGSVVGTPRYMPPEQAKDSSRVDPRCDVYAAGALLYSCLAGVPPYHDRVGVDITVALLSGPPTAIAQLVPSLPSDVIELVERSMARDLAERYPSAREMRAALARVRPSLANLPTTSDAPPDEDYGSSGSWRPRHNTTFEGQVLEVGRASSRAPRTVREKLTPAGVGVAAPKTLPDGSPGQRAVDSGNGVKARESASVPLPRTMALVTPGAKDAGEHSPAVQPGSKPQLPSWQEPPPKRGNRLLLWVGLTVPVLLAAAFYFGYLWAKEGMSTPLADPPLEDADARRAFERLNVKHLVMPVGSGADPVAKEVFGSMGEGALLQACDRFDESPADGTITYDRALGRLDCRMIRMTRATWPSNQSFEEWYLSKLLKEYTALQNSYLELSRKYPTHNDCTFGHLGSSQEVMGAIVAAGDASEATVKKWHQAAVQSYGVAAFYSADSACANAAQKASER